MGAGHDFLRRPLRQAGGAAGWPAAAGPAGPPSRQPVVHPPGPRSRLCGKQCRHGVQSGDWDTSQVPESAYAGKQGRAEEELTTCLVVCSYLPRSKRVPVAVQAEMKTMRCLGAPGAPALRCLRPRCAALTRPVPLSAARPAGARAAPRRALPVDKAELEPQPAQAKVGARGGLSAPRFDWAAGAHHARAARAGRAGGRGPVALFRAAAALLPAGPGRGRAV